MREHPDHHDAELLLRLYDLRREEKLRRARKWLTREFSAASFDDLRQKVRSGSEEEDFVRMVLGYWDMAASIVSHGLIKEEFFFENTNEFWIVWTKIKPLISGMREDRKNPYLFKNLQDVAERFEQWMAKRAPEALEILRQKLPQLSAKTPPTNG